RKEQQLPQPLSPAKIRPHLDENIQKYNHLGSRRLQPASSKYKNRVTEYPPPAGLSRRRESSKANPGPTHPRRRVGFGAAVLFDQITLLPG
ncbi:MAG: hypothetical protein P9M08_00055, partial [Candidatus Erginobacter occultus]|nr:hypothetical protein [Candidatus Erginobacter occultus]